MMRRDSISRLAQKQGVERPFRILARMPEGNRLLLGRLLGCRLQPGADPEAQSWQLINQNLRGLQARTHFLPETLSPFARNNNWWEIVTRTARRCGVRFYPGLKDEEVERLLFDHFAAELVRRQAPRGDDAERFLAELHPTLNRAIASLGLSRDGTRVVLAGLLRAAAEPDLADEREGANRVTDWLRRAMPRSWTTSISTGLRMLQQRLGDIGAVWFRLGWSRAGGNYGRVCAALAVIYLYDQVERAIEQFELVGG